MTKTVIMPKLGLTMTKGIVVSIYVKEGDFVSLGQNIIDIETDKISYQIESPMDGHIAEIYASEGDEMDVLAPLCTISE